MGGLRHAGSHRGGGSDGAVEAGEVDHLDDGLDAATLIAHPPGDGAVVLDLATRVGTVAELVLESLQQKGIARTVGKDPR